MRQPNKLLIIVPALISGLVFSNVVMAQSASSGFSASISPLPILLNVKPGSSVSTDLRVNNPSAQDEKLKVVVKTFSQDGANGTINLHDPTPADDFINWISFSRTEFDAPPGLWQTVHMTVNVPKSAAFGYYFAVEFTSTNPPGNTSGNAAKVQGAVASFVLLNAQAPGEKRQLQVTNYSTDHRFYEFLPANFSIRLHNAGNIYAGASGNIFIMRGGKQVAVLTVNGNHGLVLPGSNRLFNVAWSNGFPVYRTVTSGSQTKRQLSWNFSQISKLRFGHYTADLALVYNDGQHDIPITGSVSFWVVPWRILAVLLVIILLSAVGLWSILRRGSRLVKRRPKTGAKNDKAD